MLHIPGMPEGVHVSFSPEHGPALSTAQPDPVFALIEAHRSAYAEWDRVAAIWNDALIDTPEWDAAEAAAAEPGARERAAFRALLEARPATAAGLWALTAYLPEAVRQVSIQTGTDELAALTALREGALRLGLATVQAEVRAASTGQVDPILAAIAASRAATAAMDAIEAELARAGTTPEGLNREAALSSVELAAQDAVWRTVPTSPAGRRALLEFARWRVALSTADDGDLDDSGYLVGLILDAFAAMIDADPGEAVPPVPADADPHVALLPALRQAFAWTRDAAPFMGEPERSPERRSYSAVMRYCFEKAKQIVSLPPSTTSAGLGALALALSVEAESCIGQPENDGHDHERYPEERRLAAAVQGMMTVSGTQPLPEWLGFGGEPDMQARWDALVERKGEGSLPAWALAGKSGPDDEEMATGGERTPAVAPAIMASAEPPISDLARACIDVVERMRKLDLPENTAAATDETIGAELNRYNGVIRRAIEEASASASDLIAKSRLMLSDLDRFHPEAEETDDDERLMRVILREVIALGGQCCHLESLGA